jgi:hypothetical protein
VIVTEIWSDTKLLLGLYPGQRWRDVIHQALLLKATADGLVNAAGQPKRRRAS